MSENKYNYKPETRKQCEGFLTKGATDLGVPEDKVETFIEAYCDYWDRLDDMDQLKLLLTRGYCLQAIDWAYTEIGWTVEEGVAAEQKFAEEHGIIQKGESVRGDNPNTGGNV
jgi:hypothetical protein